MLQQTQVARVVPAFERFMASFPNPAALAAAPEATVLAHWQGLGYYRRARLLHAAARQVVDVHGGRVPTDAQALRELPGVGRYVAGAISSIVAGAREPIVDGNVARVLLRVHGCRDAPDEPATVRWLWERAGEWVIEAHDPSAANEGLMELGALVCSPRAPQCGTCPLARRCKAHRARMVDEIPAAKRRSAPAPRDRSLVRMDTIVAVHRGRIALEQRSQSGLWAGLWQMPVRPQGGWPGASHVGTVHAVLSHRRVHIGVWRATPAASARLHRMAHPGWVWVPLPDLGDRGLSNAMRRALDVAGLDAPDPARALRARPRRAGTVTT